MLDRGKRQEPTTWSVTVSPPVLGDTRWRAELLQKVRAGLEHRLAETPTGQEFLLSEMPLGIRVHRLSGEWRPGAEIRLSYQEASGPNGASAAGGKPLALPRLVLPDDHLGRLGKRLVGMDAIRTEVLLQLGCWWDGTLDAWSEQTEAEISPALRAQFEESTPLFVFHGDPGVGKSACVQAIADQYCRDAGVCGCLFWLTTDARGNGLVGDFSSRIRAAFDAARQAAGEGPAFLLIDEADAVAMRRSEAHAHQEDRAATATLLQALDSLRQGPRVAVFLTTNLLETVDAAVRRRAMPYAFERPAPEARRELFRRWFPSADGRLLNRAAKASSGMTPADIERALRQAGTQAIRDWAPLTPSAALAQLRGHERTGRV